MAVSRRPPPPTGDIGQGTWLGIRNPLYRWIKWVNANYSGIPFGFLNLTPTTIAADVPADPGTQNAGWAAADHQHDILTAAPSNPTGIAPDEGTGYELMRADATIMQGIVTTKGDLLGYSSVPARIPVGANTLVLTADSTQALGVKWAAPSGGTATDVNAQFLGLLAISMGPS